ncbi:hypothetical protein L3Q82_004368 [Scortum barcoo]|uniref:Uncharacterized protein n=1 Tax=Scortum barcoo TaxID=214431 RepID=A0ACB8VJK5_9TELE|nr:hypothetical protein L3Q82_004368 [Scortum barcoo]
MDFQKLLLDVGRALDRDEVKALAFLCTDLLGRNPATVETASELFSRLADQDHLSADRPHLLTELLIIIQRPSLIREFNLTNWTSATTNLISHYRTLLYNLSEEITKDELKDMKFILNKKLPRRKLEENVTTLEVFLEMEHMDLISNTDVKLLETIFEKVCPMLIGQIKKFKAQQVHHTSLKALEPARPRSVTEPPDINSALLSRPLRAASCEMPEVQPVAEAMDYSNISMVRCDASVMSQEKETSSEKPMSQTTNINTGVCDLFFLSFTNAHVLETYPMTAAKRGICLIINNYNFIKSRPLQNREGTMVDERCLYEVFKWLGFEVVIKRDCDSGRMLSELRELGRRDHSQMDCLVCCILSHGKEGSVYGVDGHAVLLKDLMEQVNGSKCFTLAVKPKLFFIQACQGTNEQRPVFIEADGATGGAVCSDAVVPKESIPCDADVLLAMATVPTFVSFRERKKGTWFIQSLCKNLVKMVPSSLDMHELQGANPGKTPIQILHEYGTKSGNLPVYLMEKAEGEAHQPSFVFSVKIGDVSCIGQGPSKKAAKHQAAEAALNILQIDAGTSELALQRGWRLPEYTVLMEAGPPHKREFTVTCRMESLSEKAVGNSKKAAKKAAAEKMVGKLQSLSGCSEITWTPKPSVRFENLRNSSAEKITLLRRNPLSIPNTDYIQMMLELSKEQGFEVTYFDIDELTVNGQYQYQCLAELSTSPVTVCHGTGISCSNAAQRRSTFTAHSSTSRSWPPSKEAVDPTSLPACGRYEVKVTAFFLSVVTKRWDVVIRVLPQAHCVFHIDETRVFAELPVRVVGDPPLPVIGINHFPEGGDRKIHQVSPHGKLSVVWVLSP